jgi:carbamoyl-phosphate synthase large subunit
LSELRESFAESGVAIAVSDPAFVHECADKRRTKQLFDQKGLQRPEVYLWPDVPNYPVFAKPYDGSGSKGTRVLSSNLEAELALEESDRLMLCEYFDPADHDEFTIDCYYDRESILRCAVPRQRLEVRNGEVAQALTAKNELVDELFTHMAHLAGARAMITIQAFVDRNRRTTSYIEINARVGGGYPLARRAGADYQQLLVDEYLNDIPATTIDNWRDQTLMLRYDAEIVRFSS